MKQELTTEEFHELRRKLDKAYKKLNQTDLYHMEKSCAYRLMELDSSRYQAGRCSWESIESEDGVEFQIRITMKRIKE
jgi:hypothetical protein